MCLRNDAKNIACPCFKGKGLLSDPSTFTGGDLEFMEKNKMPALKQGQAIFFASFIRHRVAPVKKGIRRSLVMWFGGQPFK